MRPSGEILRTLTLSVPREDVGVRLDKFLLDHIEDFSRTHLQKLIHDGFILINGKTVKPSHKIKPDEQIDIVIPKPRELAAFPQDIPVPVLFEDQWIAIINKPAGMVVHPSPGHDEGSLVNALLYQLDNLSGINDVLRPGIVHRLDKETSGVMVVAKNDKAHLELARQFKDRQVEKEYRAIVHGNFKTLDGVVNLPLGRHPRQRQLIAVCHKDGRPAETFYKVLETFRDFSSVAAFPKTGRTHQIRVHFQSLHHPLLGDLNYGGKIVEEIPIRRVALHAHRLKILHPESGQAMEFFAPLPEDFLAALAALKNY
jgi:23S rRNA pseudouridine1911/1915/1917 synthase